MAHRRPATAGGLRRIGPNWASALGIGATVLLILAGAPARAQSNNVRITKLSDVPFGTIANLGADAIQSQSVCVYANTSNDGYRITGTGSGSGGAFTLSSGGDSLDYEVQWSSSSGQFSGTQLSPNMPLTGQITSASHQTCNNGPATSASLIVVLRSSALSAATAGSYSGTLTLVVGPE